MGQVSQIIVLFHPINIFETTVWGTHNTFLSTIIIVLSQSPLLLCSLLLGQMDSEIIQVLQSNPCFFHAKKNARNHQHGKHVGEILALTDLIKHNLAYALLFSHAGMIKYNRLLAMVWAAFVYKGCNLNNKIQQLLHELTFSKSKLTSPASVTIAFHWKKEFCIFNSNFYPFIAVFSFTEK